MTTAPKSIAGNDTLMAVYINIPKRILWEILWDAGARLCPVGQESIDTAMKDPEAHGSIVEWIMGEAIVRECWLPKSVLKRDEPTKDGEAAKESSTDETSTRAAANVEGPPASKKKTARKAASERRSPAPRQRSKFEDHDLDTVKAPRAKKTASKKASSKKTSGKQERLGLPERMRVD